VAPGLSTQEQDAVIDALLHLKAEGPSLRRPLSGQIVSSAHGNMKELIPPRANIQILYAFDPTRTAILLLGGDTTGNWDGWYRANVPVADAIYQRRLDEIRGSRTSRSTGRKNP
jgi:hypothetical protein